MPANLLDEPEIGAEHKDFHWTLNFGPQHPATHTTLRLILELDGERIVKATPDIGYLHSGFEKLGEHLNFNQYVTIVDRKNYISPPMNEVAWHHAVEKLLDIELTKRCQYIRVIIGELARISDHLLCVGAAALDLGAFTAFLFCFNQRELIYDVYEEMSGYRFHPGYTRVGGVLHDFNDRVIDRIRTVLKSLPKALSDLEKLVLRNRIFLDRVRGVGVLTKEDAISPLLHRADRPGQRRDLRPPQGRAVPGLSRVRLPGPLRHRGGQLRPVPGPARGDLPEHGDRPAGRREPPRRPGQRPDRREVPDARQGDGLQQHGRADPALRADHAQPGDGVARSTRSTPRSRAPTASWAITWSPTAARPPGGPGPGPPRSSTSRSSRTSSRTT